MLIVKTNPAGIDWYIQQLQTLLHNRLIDADHWNLADNTKYEAYGRCNRNRTENGYKAEVYTGNNKYKEVYWDDALTAISFFGISGTPIKQGVKSEADVHFVMFANLTKLALKDKNDTVIAHRADGELRIMVQNIIGKNSFGFSYVSTELWLENVLREYYGSIRDERLKYVDMHPVHCFRINFKLLFDPNKIC